MRRRIAGMCLYRDKRSGIIRELSDKARKTSKAWQMFELEQYALGESSLARKVSSFGVSRPDIGKATTVQISALLWWAAK